MNYGIMAYFAFSFATQERNIYFLTIALLLISRLFISYIFEFTTKMGVVSQGHTFDTNCWKVFDTS
jgi:hypothetical protein